MTHDIAIFDSPTPSLSPEKAARSFYAERVPLAPPPPDRDVKWRWGVAILAALLLHLGVVTTIDDGFQRSKPTVEAPVPVEIVTEPPAPPKPVVKPPEQKPPQPQQPEPARASGGNEPDTTPGGHQSDTHKDQVSPPPAATPAPQPAEPPPPAAAPALPHEPSPQAKPVPPAASPRETQQALVPPPVPLKKPPTPPSRQAPPKETPATKAAEGSTDLVAWERAGGGDKYLNAMRDRIKANFYFPPTAEMFHLTGIAQYEIILDRQGQILNISVTQTSGYPILDKAGFDAIQRSSPFDAFPANIAPSNRQISLTLTLPMPLPR
jgi:protein TonB